MKQDNALQVFVLTKDYFGGLYDVFADSLPDNYGKDAWRLPIECVLL